MGLTLNPSATQCRGDVELAKMWILRKLLHPMDVLAAIEFLLDRMKDTKTNTEFFEAMK